MTARHRSLEGGHFAQCSVGVALRNLVGGLRDNREALAKFGQAAPAASGMLASYALAAKVGALARSVAAPNLAPRNPYALFGAPAVGAGVAISQWKRGQEQVEARFHDLDQRALAFASGAAPLLDRIAVGAPQFAAPLVINIAVPSAGELFEKETSVCSSRLPCATAPRPRKRSASRPPLRAVSAQAPPSVRGRQIAPAGCGIAAVAAHSASTRPVTGTIEKGRPGPLAQRSEQRTHNPRVAGSNPAGPTTR